MLPTIKRIKIVKEYATTLKAVDLKERTITILASTGEKDRVGEYIPPEEWKLANYEKNPVILWAHNYDQPAVAKALWSKVDKTGLIQKIQFAKTAFASELFELYSGGFMSAFSVGFMSNRDEQDSSILRNCELLEVSCVPVPCNANALAQRAANGLIKSPEGLAFVKSLEKAAEKNTSEKNAFTDGLLKELENIKHEKEDLKALVKDLKEKTQKDQKEGRVLSTKNRELIASAVSALQALLDATEPAQDSLVVPDKKKKTIIVKIDSPKEPETLAEKIAVAVKLANIPELIDREVRKMKGKVI